MKTHLDESTRIARHADHGAPPPRRRSPGFPWSLARRRHWHVSVASHLGVAVLTTMLITLVRHVWFEPAQVDDPRVATPPSVIKVEVRGGSPSSDGPGIRSFAPDDPLEIAVRHDGHRSAETKLLVRARLLSDGPGSTTGLDRPELFVTLDPRRSEWHPRSLLYRGRTKDVLPLAPGLWRLTFMLSDREACEAGPLYVCAQIDAWVRVGT